MANMSAVKQYCQISGWILAIIGLVGFFLTDLFGLIRFDTGHNVLHIVLAAISLWLGYKGAEAVMLGWTKTIGVVYLLLGVLGFFVMSLGPIGLEPTENVLHIILGAWGIWAGFFSK